MVGSRFVFTRHNRSVAELISFCTRDSGTVRSAIESLKAFQRTHGLGGLSVRRMMEEGRRY